MKSAAGAQASEPASETDGGRLSRRRVFGWALGGVLAAACRPTTEGSDAATSRPVEAGTTSAAPWGALLAAAHVWIPHPIEEARYADFLEWRAKKIPASKTAYEETVKKLDAGAKAAGAASFVGAAKEVQTTVLDRLASDADASTTKRDLLRVFAATDAWKVLGYDSFPATPRGQEAYKTLWTGAPAKQDNDGGKQG